MKRRLEVCDPTWEDLQVWWWGTIAHGRKFEVTQAFFVTYVRADRRDADLMLSFMTRHRAFLVYADTGPRPSPLMRLE